MKTLAYLVLTLILSACASASSTPNKPNIRSDKHSVDRHIARDYHHIHINGFASF
jgi:hypothetical protein